MNVWPRGWRVLVAAALGFGLLATLPAWAAGFMADDYAQLAAIERWSPMTRGLNLYGFVPGEPGAVADLVRRSLLPWFTSPDLKLSLWRPLSSALLRLDYLLWGRQALPYHVVSFLWYGGLLLVTLSLYRRTLPGALAPLAAVLFCLDDSHAMAAGWIAARHGLIAVVPVLLGLLAHLRWREQGWRPGAWLAPIACAVGLAGGESALGAMAYLWAFEWTSGRRDRLKALAPTLALALGYLVLHHLGGHGARGSTGYLDPGGDPLGFLQALPGRLLLLAAGLLLSAPIDLALFAPRTTPWFLAAGVAALVGAGLWLRSALRRADAAEAQVVRAYTLGAAAALLTAVPGLPGDRLLLPASIGGASLLAFLLRDGWRVAIGARRRLLPGTGVVLIGLTAVLVSALGLLAKGALLAKLGTEGRRVAREAEVDGSRRTQVVVLHLDDLLALFLPFVRAVELDLRPEWLAQVIAGVPDVALPGGRDRLGTGGWSVLSLGTTEHQVRRTGPDRFELWTEDGTLADGALAMAFRGTRGVPAGTVVQTVVHEVKVLEARDGRPTRIEVRFPSRLDDPSLVLLEWRGGRLRRAELPPLGPGGSPGASKRLARLPR
jgi:hypothetical protein